MIMNQTIKLCTIALSAALLTASCGGKQDNKSAATAERIEPVKVLKLERTTIERNLNLSSTLQAYEHIALAPAMQGRISSILVEVGQEVSKGQLLAKMDESAYIQAKLNFENLKTNYERISKLNESNNVSKQTYDQTKAQYDIQQANLENLERNTYLRAPFNGVISAKNYENGELFTGMPILQLVQISTLKAYMNVPESFYPQMRKGSSIKLKSDIYPDREFAASIDIVYPTIDPGSHTFQVQLKVPNGHNLLRPGMYVRSTLGFGTVQAIIVPYQSVLKLQGSNERYVFLNRNGVAKRVVVELGQRFDDQIEISSPEIHDGDELVITGQARLNDGSKLQVVTE